MSMFSEVLVSLLNFFKESKNDKEHILQITEDIKQEEPVNGYLRTPYIGYFIKTNKQEIDIRICNWGDMCCQGIAIYKKMDNKFKESSNKEEEQMDVDIVDSDYTVDEIVALINKNKLVIKSITHITDDYYSGLQFIFEKLVIGKEDNSEVIDDLSELNFVVYNLHNGYYPQKWSIKVGSEQYEGSL